MTLAQWADLDEDEPGELIDGRLVEDEEMGAGHDIAGAWLIWILRSWLASRGGFVGTSDTRFGDLATTRGRKPDTYVYLPGLQAGAPRPRSPVPPDIIAGRGRLAAAQGPRRRDLFHVEKMREYAAFGAHFYWIVDPAIRTFEILELGADGRYAHAASAADGVIDPVPGCDGPHHRRGRAVGRGGSPGRGRHRRLTAPGSSGRCRPKRRRGEPEP